MCNPCTVEGKEALDGYRKLNLIANAAPECVRTVIRVDVMLLIDCLMAKIKLNEQRSLQATKRSLQNARAIIQMKKR